MDQNNTSDNTFAIVIVVGMILAGLYFSGYWELIQRYAFDSIVVGLGMIFLFACYRSIKNICYSIPELESVMNNTTLLFLYTFFGFFLIFGALFVMAFQKSEYINQITLYSLIGLSFWFSFVSYLNLLSFNTKKSINKMFNIKIFNIDNIREIKPKKEKAFDLPDYEAFNFEDKFEDKKKIENPRKVKVGDKKIKTVFLKDVFVETRPIWEMHTEIIDGEEINRKRVNPIFFKDYYQQITIVKNNVYTYKALMIDKKDKVLFMLVDELYNLYRSVAGDNPILLESIFKEYKNIVEYVVLELVDINTKLLNNFALGQLYRYAKKRKDIRELLNAIDNVSFENIKSTGCLLYLRFNQYKETNKINFESLYKENKIQLIIKSIDEEPDNEENIKKLKVLINAEKDLNFKSELINLLKDKFNINYEKHNINPESVIESNLINYEN